MFGDLVSLLSRNDRHEDKKSTVFDRTVLFRVKRFLLLKKWNFLPFIRSSPTEIGVSGISSS